MTDGARSRLAGAAAGYTLRAFTLFPLLVGERVYEILASRSSHPLPSGLGAIVARGVVDDLAFTGIVAMVLAIPIVALAVWFPRVARWVHAVILVLLMMIAVGLSRYFSVTFVPLGADFWGYSLNDLVSTSAASAGGWTAAVPFVIAALIAAAVLAVVARITPSRRLAVAAGGLLLLAAATYPFEGPRPAQFAEESGYFLALDKSRFFAERSIGFALEEARAPKVSYSQYPLLQPPRAEDILGPMLAKVDRPPNIVFLIVEGLGRDFVGRGAEYGGFTPFLDSLTTTGLFWENFLSNAGRTFGALPSILGSLPLARGGFMELGERMPAHLSLVRLLGEHGYSTSYFTGTAGTFDQTDAFMERQGLGRFSDQSSFPPGIPKQPGGPGGFTWGYADRDMLGYSLETLGSSGGEPRLDVYQTITTHEPFIPPNADAYRRRFTERLATLGLTPEKAAAYRASTDVFATLLYVDDAIAFFLREYAKRPEYARTIFVITGDHRLVPIPFSTPISRYRVPFIIVSPLVKGPRVFSSVSSHVDITPTIAAYLSRNYGVPLPPQVPWLGSGIDSTTSFRNVKGIALMRTKNELDDYLLGTHLLSGGQLFDVGPGLTLTKVTNPAARDSVATALAAYRSLNRYATSGEHIYPETPDESRARLARVADDSVFQSLHLRELTPEQQLAALRPIVEARDFDRARAALRRMLRSIPSYHDARVLLARTYAWQNDFAQARAILADLEKRAPGYLDGHLARIDVEIWDSKAAIADSLIDQALARFGVSGELLYARARTLELQGKRAAALATLDSALARQPSIAGAAELRTRLTR